MSQVTGKKVAVTPMPTPSGTSGAIIDSFNTQDDQTVNAPSIHIVKDALTTINDNLTDKVNKLSGVTGYQTVDFIGYDATNKKLGLKVGGADTVIPFSGGLAFEDLGEVSSTTFSNGYFSDLDIGKTYLFSWYLNGSSSSARGYITLTSGAEIVNNYYTGAGAGSIQELIFKATSTTVNFSVSYPSGSSGNVRRLFKLCD